MITPAETTSAEQPISAVKAILFAERMLTQLDLLRAEIEQFRKAAQRLVKP